MTRPSITPNFNRNDPQYRYCCGCLHITTCTKLLTTIVLIMSVMSTTIAIIMHIWYGVVVSTILFAFAATMLYAIVEKKTSIFIAYAVYQIIVIICAIVIIVVFANLSNDNDANIDSELKSSLLYRILIIVYSIHLTLSLLSIYFVITCYRFLALYKSHEYHAMKAYYAKQLVGIRSSQHSIDRLQITSDTTTSDQDESTGVVVVAKSVPTRICRVDRNATIKSV